MTCILDLWEIDSSIQEQPERNLWAAVIQQALIDAEYPGRGSYNDIIGDSAEARSFLFSDIRTPYGQTRLWILKILDISDFKFQQAIRERYPNYYRVYLKENIYG